MEGVKVLVVEDEVIVSEEIRQSLLIAGFNVVGTARSAEKALILSKEHHPDVVICDINLDGEMDGIELATRLKQNKELTIIFLSAFDDQGFLERASAVDPEAYLVKPFEPKNLIVAINMAFRKMTASSIEDEDAYFIKDRIFIKEGHRFVKLMVSEVTHVEAVGSYCDIFTKERKITLSVNLKHFSSKLDNSQFVRVHRSYLVNLKAVDAFEGNVIFIGDSQIPISASHKDEFLQKIRTI